MTEIIGIKFRNAGKTYYFDPVGNQLVKGDRVVVMTAKGTDYGVVVMPNQQMPGDEIPRPLRKILRVANLEDNRRIDEREKRRQKALEICQERVNAHRLKMKLVDAEYSFDGSKLLFYFTADGRVDFRELVRDLAGTFRTRIELRQIGVRDEAKMLGGYGFCGRVFCCGQFLNDFQPVSIKMAKEQGLSLNPTKISGSCGRLMCCLKYEQDTYEELYKLTPKYGAIVNTKEGRGIVVDSNILSGILKVRLDKAPDSPPVNFKLADIKLIRDGHGPAIRDTDPSLAELED